MPSTRSAHKKYLGDPTDPHFRPKSPLITRQVFTAQQEEDLRRACTKVLSQVPHSDDENDDYLKHLARHITTKAPRERSQKKDKSSRSQQSSKPQKALKPQKLQREEKPVLLLGDLAHKTQPDRRRSDETATLSDTSRRDRDRTGESTPLTSAGITPGETGRKFFDSFSRPTTASKGILSRLDEKTTPDQKVHASLLEPSTKTSIRVVPSTAKSMTGLTSEQMNMDLPMVTHSRSAAERTFLGMLRPEFNKSLPKLPKAGQDSHTSMAIFELGKSKSQHSDMEVQQDPEGVSTSPEVTPNKKHKFKILSLFSKKRHPAQQIMT